MNGIYICATTAYRANGGGELLTKGAGLTKEEIEERIIAATEHDIRHYMMEHIRNTHDIYPQPRNNWRFIPDDWVKIASERERALLFSDDSIIEEETPDGK